MSQISFILIELYLAGHSEWEMIQAKDLEDNFSMLTFLTGVQK